MKTLTVNVAQGVASQDRVRVHTTAQATFVILADGAGGTGGGEQAAELPVTRVQELIDSLPRVEHVLSSLLDIDELILRQPGCGETTGVIVAITHDEILCASVGDSEAWYVQGDVLEVLTARQHRKPLLGSGQAMPA